MANWFEKHVTDKTMEKDGMMFLSFVSFSRASKKQICRLQLVNSAHLSAPTAPASLHPSLLHQV